MCCLCAAGHTAHTKLAFTLTLAQGGNICNTYFLAVEVASLPVNCKLAASYDFLTESRLLLDQNFLSTAHKIRKNGLRDFG